MMNLSSSTERMWWTPLARRVIGWGLAMALIWGWVPFLFGGWVGILVGWLHFFDSGGAVPPDQCSYGDCDYQLPDFTVFLPLMVMCFWMVCGAITGALAGYYAPASEPQNPFCSRFFRGMGRQTFWYWFYACLLVTILSIFIGKIYSDYWHAISPAVFLWCYFIACVVWFFLSLRNSMINALQAASDDEPS